MAGPQTPRIATLAVILSCATVGLVPSASTAWSPVATRNQAAPLSYEMLAFEQTQRGCGDVCAEISFRWPQVTAAASPLVAGAINTVIGTWLNRPLFGNRGGDPERLWEELVAARDEAARSLPDGSVGWWLRRSVDVRRNDERVLGLAMLEEMYTGGAHGLRFTGFVNLRPGDGRAIALDEVIIDGGLAELTSIAASIFREQLDIAADAPLGAAGFWFEDDVFALNDNFLIETTGLRFCYNEYEIRAYAFGPTELTIPFARMGHLLRPEFVASATDLR